jgi:hypothetical protein
MTAEPQTAIDEIEIDAPQLLKALETRQERKDEIKGLRKTFKEADGHVKTLIQEHDLQDGQAARIGRFRITKKAVPSRSVQFETDPTSRLTISLLPE